MPISFFFYAIFKGLINSISDSLFLVYWNTVDFYILILYPAALLIGLLVLIFFLWGGVKSLGFLYIIIICNVPIEQFHFFLSHSNAFYFFFLSDCSSWDFKYVLNKSGENGDSCLAPDSMMLAVDLWYIVFIILRYILSIPNFWEFLSWKYIFCQMLFLASI